MIQHIVHLGKQIQLFGQAIRCAEVHDAVTGRFPGAEIIRSIRLMLTVFIAPGSDRGNRHQIRADRKLLRDLKFRVQLRDVTRKKLRVASASELRALSSVAPRRSTLTGVSRKVGSNTMLMLASRATIRNASRLVASRRMSVSGILTSVGNSKPYGGRSRVRSKSRSGRYGRGFTVLAGRHNAS